MTHPVQRDYGQGFVFEIPAAEILVDFVGGGAHRSRVEVGVLVLVRSVQFPNAGNFYAGAGSCLRTHEHDVVCGGSCSAS